MEPTVTDSSRRAADPRSSALHQRRRCRDDSNGFQHACSSRHSNHFPTKALQVELSQHREMGTSLGDQGSQVRVLSPRDSAKRGSNWKPPTAGVHRVLNRRQGDGEDRRFDEIKDERKGDDKQRYPSLRAPAGGGLGCAEVGSASAALMERHTRADAAPVPATLARPGARSAAADSAAAAGWSPGGRRSRTRLAQPRFCLSSREDGRVPHESDGRR